VKEREKLLPVIHQIFAAILFIALVSMAIYRSPAVALMPDITIKPLRSKANAVITLLGAAGGIVAIYIIMVSGLNKHAYDHHFSVYVIIGALMLLALIIFLIKVKEPNLVKEKRELDQKLNIVPVEVSEKQSQDIDQKFTFKRRLSLYFLLAAVFFLFFGNNAVMSKIADYLPKVLNINFFEYQFILAQVVVIICIIPIGFLSMTLGRKKTVMIGMLLNIFAMGSVYFLNENQPWLTALIVSVAGIGWTMISINAYVMVVELSKGYDVGRYTGYYYAASMTAQIITPIFSGFLMDRYGRLILFPYATFFIFLAFIVMFFVKLGEAKKIKQSILESFDLEI